MIGSTSKLRNVYGEVRQEKFEDVRPNDITTEGSLIDVNSHFIAVSWGVSAGGSVAVFDAKNPTRLRLDLPLITGHTGPVCDVKFSPFATNLLATASEDSTVRLWEFPQEGLTENFTTEKQKFTGHSKKVGLLAFNPSVAEIIASGSFDNTVNIWNICNGESYAKLSFSEAISSMDWNSNGSLLGLTTKEKLVHIIDPRGNKVEMSVKAHESGKIQKMAFLTGDYAMSCGFTKNNERQIRLYDLRNFGDAIQKIPVDSQPGIMTPYFDADTGLIYLPGRGEGNMKFFDFSNGNVKIASEYRGATTQKGVGMFPKRVMNYNRCEIARFAKLTSTNTVEYLSFHIPKRNEGYDASVYPDCLTGEPALKVKEWLKGENKEPPRKNITTIDNLCSAGNEMQFEKKQEVVEEVKLSEEDRQIGQLKSLVSDLTRDNSLLKETNESLTSEMRLLTSQVERLNNELESFRLSSNEKQHQENHHVEENKNVEENNDVEENNN